MIKFKSRDIKFSIITLSMLFISIIVLTLSFKNNDLHKLSIVSQEICNVNKDLGSTINNNDFNSNESIDILKENLIKLQKLNNSLENINVKDKNINLKNQLSSYIESNIKLYESSLSILNMQNPDNFSSLYNNLLKSEQNILINTDSFKNSRLNISFPKEANIFFIKLNQYVNDSFKSTREKDIVYSQKQDFLIEINSILSDFSYLKEDLNPIINNIKDTKRSLLILISDINTKRSKYREIREKTYSIILPTGTQECYESLIEMLNSYEIYLNSIESSIKYDIENSKLDDNKLNTVINNNYKDSFDKYNTFLSCYGTLKNNIKIYKKH